jgi:hypothetical protein
VQKNEMDSWLIKFQDRTELNKRFDETGLIVPPKPVEATGVNNTVFEEWAKILKKHGGLSNIPFEVLGEYLERWTNLSSYARYHEAQADISHTTARELRDTYKKQLYVLGDGSRELRDAQVYTDTKYLELQKQFLDSYAYWTLVKNLRESYELKTAAVSREITRRTAGYKGGVQ